VRHVGAGDEQHKSDRAQQDQQWRFDLADHLFFERSDEHFAIGARKLLL
jgi:hypothetical protein